MVCADAIPSSPAFEYLQPVKPDGLMWLAVCPSDVNNLCGMSQSGMWPVPVHCVQFPHVAWPASSSNEQYLDHSMMVAASQTSISDQYLGHSSMVVAHQQDMFVAPFAAEAVECTTKSESPSPQVQGQGYATGREEPSKRNRGGRRHNGHRKGNDCNQRTLPEEVRYPTGSSVELQGSLGDTAGHITSDEGSCRQLMESLAAGGPARAAAFDAMHGRVAYLAFDAIGCRVVQEALKFADSEVATSIVSELKGLVKEATACPHANFVIQKVIELLPPTLAEFIIDELFDCVAEVATHRYGCRIICRLLEHSSTAPSTGRLLDKMLQSVRSLCCHTYGHYVIQLLVEHGTKAHRHAVVAALCSDVFKMAKSRHASHIITSMLTSSDIENKKDLADAIVADERHLPQLAEDKNGCLVIRAVCRVSGEHLQRVQVQLQPHMEGLRSSKYGRRVLEELEGKPCKLETK